MGKMTKSEEAEFFANQPDKTVLKTRSFRVTDETVEQLNEDEIDFEPWTDSENEE